MADVKFMDISENNNPATTDSILVANKENGVKRTTLGTLGNMFAVKGLLHIETVTVPLQNNTMQLGLVAPDVEGYKFAFWIQATPQGWNGTAFIANPISQSSSIWISHETQESVGRLVGVEAKVSGFAVYVKNTVA